jgi:uncharacterized protein (DUF2141 family)
MSMIVAAMGLGSLPRAEASNAVSITRQPIEPGAQVGPPAAISGAKADLALTFNVHRFQTGALMVALFDSEAAYAAGDAPVRALKLDVSSEKVQVVVTGLAPGRYGIKLFHDLKGTGKLTFNPFGIPTEPVAFSNNAKINMRAPNWAEAGFELPATGAAQTIDID